MRRDGTMRLADFVSAILHLTMAFEVFKAKDVNQDNSIKMNLNEVQNVLSISRDGHKFKKYTKVLTPYNLLTYSLSI